MAYSCVRVLFEIGHEATIRNKKTPQGFTHDWELFVRGADNTDIHYFVDKVIFHLHESFHNPKRVVKEPPYCVRESGYAGFSLPIEIYLKNRDEPYKIRFKYQLTLQESGPPISSVVREKYVFSNPSEDFRRKLIKGGGIGVGEGSEPPAGNTTTQVASVHSQHTSPEDHKSSVSKTKPVVQDSPVKKPKPKDPVKVEEPINLNDPFSSIFGQPIKTSKIQVVQKSKQISDKALSSDKQAHLSMKPTKHNNIRKDKEKKDIEKDKEKEKEKDKDKDKGHSKNKKLEGNKDKVGNDINKQKISKPVKEDVKRNSMPATPDEKLKEKVQEKIIEKDTKIEKKDSHIKKHKEKKEKTKDKYKIERKDNGDVKENVIDQSLNEIKESPNKDEKKFSKNLTVDEKEDRSSKSPREKNIDNKVGTSSNICNANSADNYVNNSGNNNNTISNNNNSTESGNSNAIENCTADINRKDKHKHHKHKKDKVKKYKREKEDKKTSKIKVEAPKQKPSSPEIQKTLQKEDSVKKHKKPLNALFEELSDKSDSECSELEVDSIIVPKQEPSSDIPKSESSNSSVPIRNGAVCSPSTTESMATDVQQEPRKRSKKSSTNKDNKKHKKKKYIEPSVSDVEVPPPVKREAVDIKDSPESVGSISPSGSESSKFTQEYITKLKELQHKIMTMDSNQELQRIVQIIAETGHYEITAKTFDFDLCLLDENTVHRLAELAS